MEPRGEGAIHLFHGLLNCMRGAAWPATVQQQIMRMKDIIWRNFDRKWTAARVAKQSPEEKEKRNAKQREWASSLPDQPFTGVSLCAYRTFVNTTSGTGKSSDNDDKRDADDKNITSLRGRFHALTRRLRWLTDSKQVY
jgi:hypothetical protein